MSLSLSERKKEKKRLGGLFYEFYAGIFQYCFQRRQRRKMIFIDDDNDDDDDDDDDGIKVDDRKLHFGLGKCGEGFLKNMCLIRPAFGCYFLLLDSTLVTIG